MVIWRNITWLTQERGHLLAPNMTYHCHTVSTWKTWKDLYRRDSFVSSKCDKCFTGNSDFRFYYMINKGEKQFAGTKFDLSFSQLWLEKTWKDPYRRWPICLFLRWQNIFTYRFSRKKWNNPHSREAIGLFQIWQVTCTLNFKTHEMTHIGEKPFVCQKYFKSFYKVMIWRTMKRSVE